MSTEMDTPESGTPAPYGQSCEACSKSKSKCILRPWSDQCARCERLKRNCRRSASKRRRTTAEEHMSVLTPESPQQSRIARLEERLDRLVTALQPLTALSASSIDSIVSAANTSQQTAPTSITNNHSVPTITPNPSSGSNPADPTAAAIWHTAAINVSESNRLLTMFKDHHMKWFPSFHLPPETTSQQLCTDRPFLWLSIITTCSRSQTEIHRLDTLFRQSVADAMVVRGEKSVDLLLGLLVFLRWYQFHYRAPDGSIKRTMALFMQMAISLVTYLRRPGAARPEKALDEEMYRLTQRGRAGVVPERTMEERRAVLGCFLITSTISKTLQNNDHLRWSGFLGDCLKEVEELQQWPGDLTLVRQVRMQLVIDNWHDSAIEPDRTPNTSLFSFYTQTLRAQLQAIQADWCSDPNADVSLHLQYHTVSLAINEQALAFYPPTPAHTPSPLPKIALRLACLASIKSWFETFFSTPSTDCIGHAFFITSQSLRCLSTLLYFSTLNEPGWSREAVWAEVDGLQVLDRMLGNFRDAIATFRLAEDDALCHHVQLYQSIRTMWVAKLAEAGGGSERQNGADGDVAAADGTNGVAGGLGGLEDVELLGDELFLFDWSSYM